MLFLKHEKRLAQYEPDLWHKTDVVRARVQIKPRLCERSISTTKPLCLGLIQNNCNADEWQNMAFAPTYDIWDGAMSNDKLSRLPGFLMVMERHSR